MSAISLLEGLLKSGREKLDAANRSGELSKYATGAAVGGALGLLLGTRRGRVIGGKVIKFGSVAALGALAWNAIQEHQARQRGAPAAAAAPPGQRSAGAAPDLQALPPAQLEQHGRAMLRAMIAAAKSDGHMDERERAQVQAQLARLEADPETRRWVDEELRRPVDPAEVAAEANTPELAAEIYLASVIVVDETTTMERAYLDELARRLNLAEDLKRSLEARAAAPS